MKDADRLEFDLNRSSQTRTTIVDRAHNNSAEATEIANCEVIPSYT